MGRESKEAFGCVRIVLGTVSLRPETNAARHSDLNETTECADPCYILLRTCSFLCLKYSPQGVHRECCAPARLSRKGRCPNGDAGGVSAPSTRLRPCVPACWGDPRRAAARRAPGWPGQANHGAARCRGRPVVR